MNSARPELREYPRIEIYYGPHGDDAMCRQAVIERAGTIRVFGALTVDEYRFALEVAERCRITDGGATA